MPKIIQEQWTEEIVNYTLQCEYVDDIGSGFSFPCDEVGNISPNLHPAAVRNYEKCLTGSIGGRGLTPMRHCKDSYRYTHPRVIECTCGAEVVLSHHFTNTCDKCSRDFDGHGHILAPRDQWGEETGETWHDIMNL